MRLINNATLTLESFMGKPPAYAILSHTWADEEVVFEDFIDAEDGGRLPRGQKRKEDKKGFRKIAMTCELARAEGLTHSWVDTCCIDKRSSAELTEAINSMFRWYADAAVCFAWLADLAPEAEGQEAGLSMRPSPYQRQQQQQEHKEQNEEEEKVEAASKVTIPGLERCRWFTRGWTLQELIAPPTVRFYDSAWRPRGTKADLGAQLARITNVHRSTLADPKRMHRLSVAARMAWAAGRETTRAEDAAYCLLGVFDVNMPLLYGEGGERAFLRLQEAIASQTNDLSLFAWTAQPAAAAATAGAAVRTEEEGGDRKPQSFRGVLASSPAEFRGAASIRLLRDAAYDPEFLITNKGLRMNTSIFAGDGGYFLGLNCAHYYNDSGPPSSAHEHGQGGQVTATAATTTTHGEELGIWIQQHGGGVYNRVRPHEHARRPPGEKPKPARIFLSRHVSAELSLELEDSQDRALVLRRGFNEHLVAPHSPEFPFAAISVLPADQWDARRRMFVTRGAAGGGGAREVGGGEGGGGGGFAAYAYFMARFDCDVFREEIVASSESFVLAFGWRAGEDEPWVSVASMREPAVHEAMGDVGRMTAAVLGGAGETRKRDVREMVLRDYYQWITKVIRVSVEAVATAEGMVVYNIDMDMVDAPDHVLNGPEGALSHPESPLYKKMRPNRRRK
ncbi:hypothetical protein JDV02_005736 [Purpureocillium takamizusanense]|uniref:Heterokaryon incompatibility domain-containing protein n=1 Tax=Purpureocillium takamizusanense TaxID=2060973 RepID=A0A9Q8QI25_9HYPO|nr:uncharacterized protein JDV02_005736 [Purpureocillium takamizusanense]UNI19556.1 hypothetical protein JDV02_005736 [Purpureocillium takamizusanense]